MTEFPQLTTAKFYLLDPDIDPPPKATSLILLNPGGVLIIGNWTEDCLAWAPKPKIPKSVKDKINKRNQR